MELKRVVVTGLGALTPIGNSVNEYWESLVNGVSGAAPIKQFDASKFKTQFACELKDFNVQDHLDRKEARKLDQFSQYAMVSTAEAMADSGIDVDKIDLSKAGVIWGSGIGGLKTFQDEAASFAKGDGTPRYNPFFIPKMIADIAAGHISIKYGFRGPNYVTVSACASANNAMIDAFNLIRLNKANVIISGGSEAAVNESGIGGFNALRALSTRNDSPQTASRPFDKNRDGLVPSGGAATLILETYESAVKAYNSSLDAFKNAEERYDLDVMNLYDFQQVKNTLFASQSRVLSSKYDYIFKTLILKFYQGEALTLN